MHQGARFRSNVSHRNCHSSICHVAVLLSGDVELDEVSRLKLAVARDTVHGLVVNADAGLAGKLVDHSRSGARPGLAEDSCCNRIQLSCGDARTDVRSHLLEYASNDLANLP